MFSPHIICPGRTLSDPTPSLEIPACLNAHIVRADHDLEVAQIEREAAELVFSLDRRAA